jgi:hypothetical protein
MRTASIARDPNPTRAQLACQAEHMISATLGPADRARLLAAGDWLCRSIRRSAHAVQAVNFDLQTSTRQSAPSPWHLRRRGHLVAVGLVHLGLGAPLSGVEVRHLMSSMLTIGRRTR